MLPDVPAVPHDPDRPARHWIGERPRNAVATNQRDGQMAYHVDGLEAGANPHVNYEPTARGGPVEARPAPIPHTPFVSGHIVRQPISRENDYGQAGERYRAFADWERDELIRNLVEQLAVCEHDIQQRMIAHLSACDADYGRRAAEGLASVRPDAPGGGGAPARVGAVTTTVAP